MNYYNDNDPFCAAWLRELIAEGLIPKGEIDGRSISEVQPEDLRGFVQCHFFAGIGGWAYALRIANWPDRPVWTGSCPCQPFSQAGKRKGEEDPRHFWPAWFRLIRECRPAVLFGEQVAGADGKVWLAGVSADLAEAGYRFGAADLPAAGVGAPHIRQRLFWVADSGRAGLAGREKQSARDQCEAAKRGCRIGGVANVEVPERMGTGKEGNSRGWIEKTGRSSPWSDSIWWPCRDGKSRRIPVEPVLQRLVAGLAGSVDDLRPESGFPLTGEKVEGRTGLLRGYGNSIVVQIAAEFISAYMDILELAPSSNSAERDGQGAEHRPKDGAGRF